MSNMVTRKTYLCHKSCRHTQYTLVSFICASCKGAVLFSEADVAVTRSCVRVGKQPCLFVHYSLSVFLFRYFIFLRPRSRFTQQTCTEVCRY
jgi:hypothetical protein